VVGPDGEQLGVLPIEQALARAQELGMDLVEISPTARPPVCKIMDYGRFKYTEKKKQNEAKKKQVVVQLKEVKLRPRTEEHDYDVKVRKIREFLQEANKARVTVMFRGRELSHRELGQKVLQEVIEDTKEYAVIESAPRMEGRQMFMILAPNPKMLQRQRDQAKAKAETGGAPAPATGAAAQPGHPAAPPQQAPTPAEGTAPAAPRTPEPTNT
jgi:translation initiation factor IF-3